MNSTYTYLLVYGLIAIFFSVAELLHPAYPIPYRKVVISDLMAGLLTVFMTIVVQAILLANIHLPSPGWIQSIPIGMRLIIFLLIFDFGLYWAHRGMHLKWFWRFHRWHHFPNYMYWGAGQRASLVHSVIYSLIFVLSLPWLSGASPWIYFSVLIAWNLQNNIMHMNVSWNFGWLEKIIVTPKYHHIHHSSNLAVRNQNFGAFFIIWDKIFGTYLNPSAVSHLEFGCGERKSHPLMFLGW